VCRPGSATCDNGCSTSAAAPAKRAVYFAQRGRRDGLDLSGAFLRVVRHVADRHHAAITASSAPASTCRFPTIHSTSSTVTACSITSSCTTRCAGQPHPATRRRAFFIEPLGTIR
jgi:hypothetical protein